MTGPALILAAVLVAACGVATILAERAARRADERDRATTARWYR